MAQLALHVRPIEAVSPTLAEALRLCKLRAGLCQAEDASQYVLGNPNAWLGTAYHAVLEALGSRPSDDLEFRVRELWDVAIQSEHDRARVHPFDKRFGPPESWPRYHIVAAMALVRAKELVGGRTRPRSRAVDDQTRSDTLREKKFSGAEGKIVGRPDIVRPEEVVDFKTGKVFEDEDQEQVKGSYLRQLRLYAFLVRETLGWWPRRGVLLPMTGSPVGVDLEPGECEREAEDAVELLEEYNSAIAGATDSVGLATPSPRSCRWCPYQLYCPAFWSSVAPEWADGLSAGAIEGSSEGSAVPIHNGLALSLWLQVGRGTVPAGKQVSLFPLDPSVHQDLPRLKAGDQVRVTGLWRRPDDSVVATKRTMIAIERNLPAIVLSPEGQVPHDRGREELLQVVDRAQRDVQKL